MEHMLRLSPGLFRLLPLVLLVTLASNTSAQAPAAPVPESPRERSLLAEKYAVERLSVWQKRLKLQDWNISLIVSRATELKPKPLGNIHWDTDKKSATIRVLDPA